MEKVLVCLLASTRAHRLTFPSFKRQVLDELGGDLAVALAIDEKYDYANPMWQHAKYRWTARSYRGDYGEAYDFAQRWLCHQHNIPVPDWRKMLQIKGIWQGGIRSPNPEPSASALLPFCRWLLLNGLQQDEILDRYDRFVITRADFRWLCPHPPLSILDRDAIWMPNGEDYYGLNDRHLVASRADVVNCLNLLEEVLLRPDELYEEMKLQPEWGNEQMLGLHFKCKGILHKVKRFPYVMYTAREVDDNNPTWSWGYYEPTVGHYVKYKDEFRLARSYATVIRSRADWEGGTWKQFDPASFTPPSIPLARRLRYAAEGTYYKIVSALNRPGRFARLSRFCKLIFQRAERPPAGDPTKHEVKNN